MFELQDDIAHSEVVDSLMCSAGRIPFACYQQMILCYKTLVLLHCMMLIFDVMQRRIIDNDSITPGTIYSPRGYTICGRIYEACNLQNIFTSHSMVTANPCSRTTQTGNGKSSSIACARFRMGSNGLRSKFTNGFYSCL